MKTEALDIKFDFPILVTKKYSEEYKEAEKWYLEGYAATSDFDLQGDIISPEALKKAADNLIENSTVLYNHNENEAIGRVVESKWTSKGLWLKVLISKTAPNRWQQIKEGVLNKFSITAKVLDARKEFVAELGKVANIIKELYLIEASLVSVPANNKARAIGWYVGKALNDYEKDGGEIMSEFETVVKNEEMELARSFDASPNLTAASADDNKETDESKLKEQSVVQDGDSLEKDGRSKEDKQKQLSEALKKSEGEESTEDNTVTDESGNEEVKTEEKEEPKDEVKQTKTEEKEEVTEKKKKSVDSSKRTRHTVTKSNGNVNRKTQKSVTKKNFDTVKSMLMDIHTYLDSPDADSAIPEAVKTYIGEALEALSDKSASVKDNESDLVKSLKSKVQKLEEEKAKLVKQVPVKRKGLVRERTDDVGQDSKREAIKSAGTPEARLKKALELGIM